MSYMFYMVNMRARSIPIAIPIPTPIRSCTLGNSMLYALCSMPKHVYM